jgi:ATP-dependent DNA helicase RecQ
VLFYSWADVKLHERFLDEIEDPELWRAKRQTTVSLFNLLESNRCRHRMILRHFDEEMEPCDRSCDVCTGVTVAELAAEAMMGTVRTARSRRPTQEPATGSPRSDPLDEPLFESLRSLRKELADAQRVPAYIVFSDKVLWEMAARRPTTPAEMLEVPGVGPAKLKRYGSAFLNLVRSHLPGTPSGDHP